MPDQKTKDTITVGLHWYSSDPIFNVAVATIREELRSPEILPRFLYERSIEELRKIIPLDNDQFFTGNTQYGPHTHLYFEVKKYSEGDLAARSIMYLFEQKFCKANTGNTFGQGGKYVRFGGKQVDELLDHHQTLLNDIEQHLKKSRRLFPDKKARALRLRIKELYS